MDLPKNGEAGKIYRAIGVAVIGMLAGGGGSIAVEAMNPSRPDPFTGTMGREMREEIMRALQHQETRVQTLETIASPYVSRLDAVTELLRECRVELRDLRVKAKGQ